MRRPSSLESGQSGKQKTQVTRLECGCWGLRGFVSVEHPGEDEKTGDAESLHLLPPRKAQIMKRLFELCRKTRALQGVRHGCCAPASFECGCTLLCHTRSRFKLQASLLANFANSRAQEVTKAHSIELKQAAMPLKAWSTLAFEGKGKREELCRLLSFQNQLKLQNICTGELLDLPSGTEISEETKAVIKPAEDESQEDRVEIPLADFFKLSLGYDDEEREVLLQEGSFFGPLETIENARDTVALELLLQTERPMKWQTECYLFHIPKCSAPVSSVRFAVRWLVDALGGAARRNFIGASAETWKNHVQKYLEETAAEDAQAEAEQHLTASSWSKHMVSRKRKESEREDGPAEQLDYHCSVFCLLTLLVMIAVGVRKTSSWKLPDDMLKEKAKSMLRAVTWHFADSWFEREADENQDGCDFVIELRKHEGQVMLNWQRLIEKKTSLQAMFPGPPAELELSDVLVRLRTDQTANTCSWQRRDACRALLAFLFLVISDCIEASLRSKLWSETKVEQLKQLRTRLRGLCFCPGFCVDSLLWPAE